MSTTVELTEEVEAALDELAGAINEAHEAAQGAIRDSLLHAKVAGERLIEAKERVKEAVGHGHWGTWLKENCDVSERTAQYYMQIARDFAKLTESNPQAIAEMTMEAAIDRLAEARRASNQSSPPGKDGFHNETQIARARRLLGEHVGGFLQSATKERLYLDIVVQDRELHRAEVEDVRKVLLDLRHRVIDWQRCGTFCWTAPCAQAKRSGCSGVTLIGSATS